MPGASPAELEDGQIRRVWFFHFGRVRDSSADGCPSFSARRVPPASGFRPGEWSCQSEFRKIGVIGSNRRDLVNDEVLTGLLRSSRQQPPRPVIVRALRRSCFVHLVWSTGPTDTLYGDRFRGLVAANGCGPELSRVPVFGLMK